MRLKPLPKPPEDIDGVFTARDAVPIVPGDEMDCCARLADRLSLEEREEARRWLTLLRALGLAVESDAGFSRVRGEVSKAALSDRFLENVYGAREVHAALDEDPRTPMEVFERVEDSVPRWERDKHGGAWRQVWRDRTEAVLGWLALLELARVEQSGSGREGYNRTTDPTSDG